MRNATTVVTAIALAIGILLQMSALASAELPNVVILATGVAFLANRLAFPSSVPRPLK